MLVRPLRRVVSFGRKGVNAVTVREAVALFRNEMIAEIFNSCADEPLRSELIQSVKNVESLVLDTVNAEAK